MPTQRPRTLLGILALLALALPSLAAERAKEMPDKSMQKPPADARRCLTSSHGLGGFDPVSYQAGAPQRGSAELFLEHEQVRYLFATEANRDSFAAQPERYLPRYGGWCAMSLALGSFTCPDYENFQIEDGELLLFETTVHTNGRTLWNQDAAGNRVRADRHYAEKRAP